MVISGERGYNSKLNYIEEISSKGKTPVGSILKGDKGETNERENKKTHDDS